MGTTADYLIGKHLKSHELFVENPLWTIKKSSLGGRGLFSSRDIEAGEVIFKDSPLIIGPRAGITCPIVCTNCYSKENLYACTNNCGLPVCSKKCQNSTTHKNECDFIVRVNKSEGFSKIEIKLVKCLTPVRSVFLSDHQKELLVHLCAHMGSQHGHEVDILKNELQFNLSESEEITMRLACSVLDANSFEVIVGNEDNQSSLRGLYPLSSLMNHNCVPNTMHIFNKNQNMIVKATTFIPAGQELFHCYTRLFWGTSVRRPHLVTTKHFYCNCARCKDPTEFGTNMSAMKCLKCSEIVLPYFVNRTKMIWKCTSCQDIISNRKAGFLISVFASSLNTFETSTVESVLKFIREKLLNHLTSSSQIVLELKYKLLWIIGYNEKYLWKDISNELIGEKENICRELLELLNMLSAGQCKMRGLLLYELYSCLKEQQRRACLEKDTTKDNNLSISQEMRALLEESKDILMDDVHAPLEIKMFSSTHK